MREFSRIDCTSECYKLIIITCLIGYGELHDIKATNLLSLCSMGIDLCCIWANHDWTIYALWLVQRIIGNWDLNNEFSSQLYTHSEALKREFRWNGLWWRQNEPNRTSKQNKTNQITPIIISHRMCDGHSDRDWKNQKCLLRYYANRFCRFSPFSTKHHYQHFTANVFNNNSSTCFTLYV